MKLFLTSILIVALLGGPVFPQSSPEIGVVKVRVDIDNVHLVSDHLPIDNDSYGNPLNKDSWFILNIAPGEHELVFNAVDYESIERVISIADGEVVTVEINFTPSDYPDTVSTGGAERLPGQMFSIRVVASPDSVLVAIDDSSDWRITPFEIEIPTGSHVFSAARSGFDSLDFEYEFSGDTNIKLNFILAKEKPSKNTADELGLDFRETRIAYDEQEAEKLKKNFNNMAESFLLIPTGQGVLARLIMGNDNSKQANMLIAVGAGMTVTTFLLGKIISSRKLNRIKKDNAIIEQENQLAKEHNKNMQRLVDEKNDEIISLWQSENKDRGIVEIEIE